MVNFAPWPIYHRERTPVPIEKKAGWNPEAVWTFCRRKISCSYRNSNAEPSRLIIFAIFCDTKCNLKKSDRMAVGLFLRRVRSIAKSDYSFVMPVRPSSWNNSAPTGRILMKFDIWVFFENLSRKFKFH